MSVTASLSTLSPAVTIHIVFAIGALALGPVALTVPKGSRLHRAAGYSWVTLMTGAALSSVFIRDFRLPNIAGYTPIHILTVAALAGVVLALVHISRGRVKAHRRAMWMTYGGAVLAAMFALLPGRFFGDMVWRDGVRTSRAVASAPDSSPVAPLPRREMEQAR